jgi:Cu/Ag efflux protein CusF
MNRSRYVALAFLPAPFHLMNLALLTSILLMSACQSAPEKHYPFPAEVISVDVPRKLIVVKHGEIPGLMPAMTMSYAVLDSKDIESLYPGDKISFKLVVADNKGHLEKIVLLAKALDKQPSN